MKAREVAHRWANQAEDKHGALAAKAGNVSYEGQDYVSYRTTVARLFPEKNAVLISSHRYSATTDRQLSYARGALDRSRYAVFNVPDVGTSCRYYCGAAEPDHKKNIESYVDTFTRCIDQAGRARQRKLGYYVEAREALYRARQYASTFCPELVPSIPLWPDEHESILAELTVKANEVEAQRGAKEAEAKAARMRKETEHLAYWRVHDARCTLHNFAATALRISTDGADIETTHGAVIPVAHAKKAWPYLRDAKQAGTTLDHTTMPRTPVFGPYPFRRFDGEYLVVGCHTIPWSELEYVAKLLDLA